MLEIKLRLSQGSYVKLLCIGGVALYVFLLHFAFYFILAHFVRLAIGYEGHLDIEL